MGDPLLETVEARGHSWRDADLTVSRHFRRDQLSAPAAAASDHAAQGEDPNSCRTGGPQVERTSRTPSSSWLRN
jgi:hypothetical protein